MYGRHPLPLPFRALDAHVCARCLIPLLSPPPLSQTQALGSLSVPELIQRLHWLDLRYQRDQTDLAVLHAGCKSDIESYIKANSK